MSDNLSFLMKQLWMHFSAKRKKQFVSILFLMVLSSFAELLSLGAILPFLSILSDPSRSIDFFINFPFDIHRWLSQQSNNWLLIFFTGIFILCTLLSALIRFLSQYALIRFSHSIGADFNAHIVRLTLYQPYIVHCSKNSSEFLNMLTLRVNETVYAFLVPILTLASSILLAIAILVGLFVIQPFVALISLLGFGSIYVLVSVLTQRKLVRHGKIMHVESTKLLKILQECIGGIKDILINGTQKNFLNFYLKVDGPLRYSRSSVQIISTTPKYFIETVGMIIMALIALYLTSGNQGSFSAIPVIGAMALGAQKLLPIMQTCFFSWSQIQTFRNSLPDVIKMLEQPVNDSFNISSQNVLSYKKEICFDSVSFRYISMQPYVLQNSSFSISRGARVGIVGKSGSGKSTLADLFMGLLTPDEGKIYVDDQELSKHNLRSFQNLIAHVPQDIFLTDASVAENIAFGIPEDQINFEQVRQAAIGAHLLEIEQWPDGFNPNNAKLAGAKLLLVSGEKPTEREQDSIDENPVARNNFENMITAATRGMAMQEHIFIAQVGSHCTNENEFGSCKIHLTKAVSYAG
mgnify:CR=1 FL=1